MDGIPTLGHTLLPVGQLACQLVVVFAQLAETHCLTVVELLEVIVQLALHGVMGRDSCDRAFHHLDPCFAIGLLAAIVVERDDVVLQQAIDGGSIQLVLVFLVLVGALLWQSPARTFAIAFNPPAIEHREIDHTVHFGLLARCSRGFQGARRRVHPNVDTRH